jgi:hypothetical protein
MGRLSDRVQTWWPLALRLAYCEFGGIVAGAISFLILAHLLIPSRTDSSVAPLMGYFLIIGGMLVGIPFYLATVFILLICFHSIIKHPLIWCIGIPGALTVLMALASRAPNQIPIFTVIPLSATYAGIIFYFWLRWAPPD